MIGLPADLIDLVPAVDALLGFGDQQFTTIPTSNDRPAIYVISIRAPGLALASVASVTLPITPTRIIKKYTALSSTYNVQGSPGQGGVSRNIDMYGNTPPSYMIEGTTGWQRHAADGFSLTGLQAILQLDALLQQYAALNQAQAAGGSADMYSLEFYDYFADQYWQVVPVGEQGIQQDASRPLLFYYSFRWDAIKAVSDPPPPITADPILAAFATTASTALSVLGAGIGSTLTNYAAATGGALLSLV